MSILNYLIVYKPLKDTLKFRRGTRKAYFTLVGLPGRARACHQKRGGVGIFVHVPGHTSLFRYVLRPSSQRSRMPEYVPPFIPEYLIGTVISENAVILPQSERMGGGGGDRADSRTHAPKLRCA